MLPSHFWMSLRSSLSSFTKAYTAAPGKEHLASPLPSFWTKLGFFLEGALLLRPGHPRIEPAAAALCGVAGKETASRLMTSDGTATGSLMHN